MTDKILIVGAGAAGLACAERLHEEGRDFLLMEARNRIGGRVHCQWDDDFCIPLELGAEFIHGADPLILDRLLRYRIPFYDVTDSHLLRFSKALTYDRVFWSDLRKFLDRMALDSNGNRSVEEFLEENAGLDPQHEPFFRSFVEGFYCADLRLIGERELTLAEQAPDRELNGSRTFRLLRPYREILERMASEFANGENIILEATLQEIQWSPGQVVLRGLQGANKKPITFATDKVVLALPLTPLQRLQWDPLPRQLTELSSGLRMGHAHRMILRFRSRFWESLTAHPISFLHLGADFYFPTWWTFAPLRTPHLVAWQGGPKALELSKLSQEERLDQALSTLAYLSDQPKTFLYDHLDKYFYYDWSADPFTQGSYTYALPDGEFLCGRCQNIENTIFLAGEAFATARARGTVQGAMQSGINAANFILQGDAIHATAQRA